MDWILNPLTNRYIKMNGKTYKDLIHQGFVKEDLEDYTRDPKPILPRAYLNKLNLF